MAKDSKDSKNSRKGLNNLEKVEERSSAPKQYETQNIESEIVGEPSFTTREQNIFLEVHSDEAMTVCAEESKSIFSHENLSVEGHRDNAEDECLIDSSKKVAGNCGQSTIIPTIYFSRNRQASRPFYSTVTESIRSERLCYLKSLSPEDGIPNIISNCANGDNTYEANLDDQIANEAAEAPANVVANVQAGQMVDVPANEIADYPQIRPIIVPQIDPVGGLANRVRNNQRYLVPNGHAIGFVNNPPDVPSPSAKAGRNLFMWTICIALIIIFGKVMYMWKLCTETESSCTQLTISGLALYAMISVFLFFLCPTICGVKCFRRR